MMESYYSFLPIAIKVLREITVVIKSTLTIKNNREALAVLSEAIFVGILLSEVTFKE